MMGTEEEIINERKHVIALELIHNLQTAVSETGKEIQELKKDNKDLKDAIVEMMLVIDAEPNENNDFKKEKHIPKEKEG